MVFSLLLIHCATIKVGTERVPLGDERIERKIEIKLVSSPHFDLEPSEELNAYSKVDPNFVLRFQELIRERHNYNSIITYEKYLHPIAAWTMGISGCVLGGVGCYLLLDTNATTGYIALGRDLIGVGSIGVVSALFLGQHKKYIKTQKKFDDDIDFTPIPLHYKYITVEINETPYSLVLKTDSLGVISIPADSIIKLCPEKAEINFLVKLADEPTVKQELTIPSSFITLFNKFEEAKKQEEIRLAKLERERKELEAKILKIIEKVWTQTADVKRGSVSVEYKDSTVTISYAMSKKARQACIKAGKLWGGRCCLIII